MSDGLILQHVKEDPDRRSCFLCLQELKDSVDPRQLPCGLHMACMECLDSMVAETTTLKCQICKSEYKDTHVEGLVKVEKAENLLPIDDKSEVLPPCDRCDKDASTVAAEYCLSCAEKICNEHKGFHDGYFGDSHQTIRISEYLQKPTTYCGVRRCEKHPDEIAKMACQIDSCFMLSCVKCFESGEISGIGSHTHKFRPLMELDTDLRKHFRGHLDNLDSQLDRNYQEGKQFDKTFDEITEDCKKWKEEVAAKTEIQIDYIRSQSKLLLERIDAYEKESTDTYSSNVNYYITREDDIKSMVGQVTNFLGEADLKRLMHEKNDWNTKVDAVVASRSHCSIQKKTLRVGKKRKMEIDLTESSSQSNEKFYKSYLANVHDGGYGRNRTYRKETRYQYDHTHFFNSDGVEWSAVN